jgi:inorganic pyrophosphatase
MTQQVDVQSDAIMVKAKAQYMLAKDPETIALKNDIRHLREYSEHLERDNKLNLENCQNLEIEKAVLIKRIHQQNCTIQDLEQAMADMKASYAESCSESDHEDSSFISN